MEIDLSIYVNISSKVLDINKMFDFLKNPSHGALSFFIGSVRNYNMNKNVIGVSYDVFEPLAIEIFQKICIRAKEQWGSDLNIYLEHFRGHLEICGKSVVIGVSSTHRTEALNACQYIIEQVKHHSPIWKQEHYENASSEWIKGHSLCGKYERDEMVVLRLLKR